MLSVMLCIIAGGFLNEINENYFVLYSFAFLCSTEKIEFNITQCRAELQTG